MRIGIVTQRQPSTVGGGYSFHTTVLKALQRINTPHEFVPLHVSLYGGSISSASTRESCLESIDVNILFRSNELKQERSQLPTELAARSFMLDVVWYLDPLAEVLSVPVFATVLDLEHRKNPYFPEVSTSGWDWEAREKHYRSVLPRAARIFTGTETGKQEIIRAYGVSSKSIVVNPFPTPELPKPSVSQAEEVLSKYTLTPGYLFYPAQLWPHKNHVNLLMALQILAVKQNLELDLVLTGSDQGNLAYIHRVTNDLGLKDRVHFLGFVPEIDMAALYRHAAMLVYPSFFGPDNLPPLEAFSSGCPVVTAKIDGVQDQLGQGTVSFFDPTSPEDISSAIMTVLNNISYRQELIQNGYLLAAERSPEAYVQTVIHTFDEFQTIRRTWPPPAETRQPPISVTQFPEDLNNDTIMHQGIYTDGWVEKRSSLVLRATQADCHLKINGEVPYSECTAGLSVLLISIDGQLEAIEDLPEGNFTINLTTPTRPGWHRIDLEFSRLHHLAAPDTRLVAARLEFIGFTDAPPKGDDP